MRITNDHLQHLINLINDELGVPREPYKNERAEDGTAIHNPGTCYLSGAYGGWRIEQMSESGGSRDLLDSGYKSKREVYERASCLLEGLKLAKKFT